MGEVVDVGIFRRSGGGRRNSLRRRGFLLGIGLLRGLGRAVQ
jgi:hypothetical protein